MASKPPIKKRFDRFYLVGKHTNMTEENDRRKKIVMTGIAILREHGFTGFTQPRIAKRAGVRQSHLTYYFPTRADLVKAVAHAAVDRQLNAVGSTLKASSSKGAAVLIANITARRENTRVIMALAQAADEEPALHDLFRELADGIIARVGKLFEGINIKPTDEHCFLLHALLVGMSVINLAVAGEGSEQRSARTLERLLKLMQTETTT
jgi:AcrR family transcriptional regulator